MDWANDQLGKLVHAAEKRLFAYGFTCPTCGERVRLRAGQERRPHFAHYSHSIKRDCENYHPSSHEIPARVTSGWTERPTAFKNVSLRGGVFLDRAEGGRFSLILKLPRLKPDAEESGELQIRSSFGVRSYKASQLKRPQFLPVSSQVPLVEVSATDEFQDAVAAIREDISLFQASGNVFRAGDDCGRLLAPGEALEWGESYRVVTKAPLLIPFTNCKFQEVARFGTHGWLIYDVELPHFADEAQASVGRMVTKLLGRTIKLPAARVFIIDPPPHHIDPDGTYVYPTPPERLILRRTTPLQVYLDGSAKSNATIVQDLGTDWIEIRGISSGEFSIQVEGHAQISGRIEECEFFRPEGVRVLLRDAWWELFDVGLRKAFFDHPLELLVIECPTMRVADLIHLGTDAWSQRGASYTLKHPVLRPSIDGRNFGVLTWPEQLDAAVPPAQLLDAESAVRRVWIEGLVMRQANHDVLLRLQNWWKGNNPAPLSIVQVGALAWLNPYLLLMSKKGEAKDDVSVDQ